MVKALVESTVSELTECDAPSKRNVVFALPTGPTVTLSFELGKALGDQQ